MNTNHNQCQSLNQFKTLCTLPDKDILVMDAQQSILLLSQTSDTSVYQQLSSVEENQFINNGPFFRVLQKHIIIPIKCVRFKGLLYNCYPFNQKLETINQLLGQHKTETYYINMLFASINQILKPILFFFKQKAVDYLSASSLWVHKSNLCLMVKVPKQWRNSLSAGTFLRFEDYQNQELESNILKQFASNIWGIVYEERSIQPNSFLLEILKNIFTQRMSITALEQIMKSKSERKKFMQKRKFQSITPQNNNGFAVAVFLNNKRRTLQPANQSNRGAKAISLKNKSIDVQSSEFFIYTPSVGKRRLRRSIFTKAYHKDIAKKQIPNDLNKSRKIDIQYNQVEKKNWHVSRRYEFTSKQTIDQNHSSRLNTQPRKSIASQREGYQAIMNSYMGILGDRTAKKCLNSQNRAMRIYRNSFGKNQKSTERLRPTDEQKRLSIEKDLERMQKKTCKYSRNSKIFNSYQREKEHQQRNHYKNVKEILQNFEEKDRSQSMPSDEKYNKSHWRSQKGMLESNDRAAIKKVGGTNLFQPSFKHHQPSSQHQGASSVIDFEGIQELQLTQHSKKKQSKYQRPQPGALINKGQVSIQRNNNQNLGRPKLQQNANEFILGASQIEQRIESQFSSNQIEKREKIQNDNGVLKYTEKRQRYKQIRKNEESLYLQREIINKGKEQKIQKNKNFIKKPNLKASLGSHVDDDQIEEIPLISNIPIKKKQIDPAAKPAPLPPRNVKNAGLKKDTQQSSEDAKRIRSMQSQPSSQISSDNSVRKQVDEYIHLVNKMGQTVVKSKDVAKKMNGQIQLDIGMYFMYKIFYRERQRIQKILEEGRSSLSRWGAIDEEQWKQWLLSNHRFKLLQKVKNENIKIKSSISNMQSKKMKKQLPRRIKDELPLCRSQMDSALAVQLILNEYDYIFQHEELSKDAQMLQHICQALLACLIAAQLDGKIGEKKPLSYFVNSRKSVDQLGEIATLVDSLYTD